MSTSRGNEAPRPARLVANIMHFARVLRAAGLPVGPGKVLDALAAVRAVGITDRHDFYWTLHAVFVNQRAQRHVFDQAFHVFWRNPRLLERMMAMLLPTLRLPEASHGHEMNRRLADALYPSRMPSKQAREREPELEVDASLTWSDSEVSRHMDFEQMTAAEVAQAKTAIARMRPPVADVPTRRFEEHPHGPRVDMRASLRAALRGGPDVMPLLRRRRRVRPPPLVLVCDISGSMSRYSRMLLHFAHTIASGRRRVHCFVFGTRLTNVTRELAEKDVDMALAGVAKAVSDWSGGTRIGACLHTFNRLWSRRVLGQGAVVVLVTDGLDRDAGEGLAREMERLHKSCRRLIWLNPLLRYDDFEPRALGMKAMLPHVDELRSAHNLESLAMLVRLLGGIGSGNEEGGKRWATRRN